MDISAENITFSYDISSKPALKDISFNVKKGEFIAVLGANGSGKSTLARHLNGILPTMQGNLTVCGINTKDEKNLHSLRRLCGMVFQNPDNQFVSDVVEEDVSFGLINFDETDIEEKVSEALRTVDMKGYERRSPHNLSGGQKQRIAAAGVIALSPQIVVFDEATSMLDPEGKKEILSYLKKINSMGKTVIMITHFTEEAVIADRIFIMNEGRIIKTGTPEEVLTDKNTLLSAKLTPPFAVEIYYELIKQGVHLEHCPLTDEELSEEICRLK